MKKAIIIILCLSLSACMFNTKINMSDLDVIKQLKDNKDNIVSTIVKRTTLGGQSCYKLDNKEAYDYFTNLDKAKDSGLSVTDDYITYYFYLNNNEKIYLSFEQNYFQYDKVSYEIDDFKHMSMTEENEVECE